MNGRVAASDSRSLPQVGLVLLVFAVLVCSRMPDILLEGRFWAEEGKYFFLHAWTLPPMQALLIPVGGYLNIVANAATLAARWLLPLRLAPYLTIAVALTVQLLPPLLLLRASDPWLRPLRVRVAGVVLLLLVPASEEIWLQTLHCQFELTLCCALILCLQTASGAGAAGRLAILLLAPLSGPGAIALVPLFALRLATDRSAARLLQLLALSAAGAAQVLLFMTVASGRAYALDPAIGLCILSVRHLALPFLGPRTAQAMAEAIRHRLASGHVPHVATALPLLVLGAAGVATIRSQPPRPAFWLLLSALCTACVAYFGAIGQPADLIDTRFGERYAFVPEALFSLSLLALACTVPGAIGLGLRLLLGWQMVGEAIQFERVWPLVAHGPAWRPQVSAWRADPSRPLQLWPDGWTVNLPPR